MIMMTSGKSFRGVGRVRVVVWLVVVVGALAGLGGTGWSAPAELGQAVATPPPNGLKPATSAKWKQVLARACQEGSVTLYTNLQPGLMGVLADDFAKKFRCIKLNWTRIISAQMIPKVQQEQAIRASNGADVVTTEIFPFFDSLVQGSGSVVAPIGPNAKLWPAKYVRAKAYVQMVSEPFVMIYNKNLVSAPASYKTLLEPALRGKIATTAVLNTTSIVSWYQFLDRRYGPNYLEQFAANRPRVLGGTGAIAQAVAAGDSSYGAFSTPSTVQPLIQAGAPIGIVLPKPAAVGNGIYEAILRWGRHPNAAQVLVNYLMSRPTQTLWAKTLGAGLVGSPLRVPGSVDPASIQKVSQFVSQAQVDAFSSQFNRLFTGG
jgi:iron(III) transport system substrate-binding protein